MPGREGLGLTDRIDSVVSFMKQKNILVFDQNYGLWYDRRRDDHERIRRRDGDVWGPFYEQPFGRSGQGTAWEGLSKYDLKRPNAWYWSRLKEFAEKGSKDGLLLFHETTSSIIFWKPEHIGWTVRGEAVIISMRPDFRNPFHLPETNVFS